VVLRWPSRQLSAVVSVAIQVSREESVLPFEIKLQQAHKDLAVHFDVTRTIPHASDRIGDGQGAI
jgi:hypothetical protein